MIALAGCSQGLPAMGPGAAGAVGEPIVARHAYVVQATYRMTRDGGAASGGPEANSGSQTFTLAVDPMANRHRREVHDSVAAHR